MENFNTKTVREIAVEVPASVRIFEEYKIDFCCGGGRNFDEACQMAGVEPEILSEKINRVLKDQKDGLELPDTQSPSSLIDYILAKHHVFTRYEITRLSALLIKVCRKHGPFHPELIELQKSFVKLCDDLSPHMLNEENVLFPFIKQLEKSQKSNLFSPRPPFGTVKNPVRMMMIEHDAAGDILRKMREITSDYAVPENACSSFRTLYFGLEELEKDLHRHIHFENNVLFPQAVRLEQKIIFGY